MTYEPPILPVEPTGPVMYGPEVLDEVRTWGKLPFRELFHRFLNGYESQSARFACQLFVERLLAGALAISELDARRASELVAGRKLDVLSRDIEPFRDAVADEHRALREIPLDVDRRSALILLHRGPSALTDPSWLDNVSQPATQPAKVVNALFRIYGLELGNGDMGRSFRVSFQKLCASRDVLLPPATSVAFARHPEIADFAYLGPCYRLAIGRHPRLFLPEIIGTTLAHYTLRMDPLSGAFDGDQALALCRDVLQCMGRLAFSPRWPALECRILRGFEVELALELHFWRSLRHELSARSAETPAERMCALVQRVARFAGEHHHGVVFEGRPLAEWLAEAEQDPRPFVTALGRSAYFDREHPARSRFFQLLSIDGPMFAIFSKEDGKIIKEWAQSLASPQTVPAQARSEVSPAQAAISELLLERSGGDSALPSRYAASDGAPGDPSLRQLFYWLINVDMFPCVLPLAKQHVARVLEGAEPYLRDGSSAKYSDATFFPYSPAALEKRMEDVYFGKLLTGYRPIAEMPPRALVVTRQTMLALGSLIDGAWIHKLGRAPQYDDSAAQLMFGIYADEMGYGDMRLNHIMVARRVLDSMDVDMPEMAEHAYAFNETVPEKCYAFLAYQLAISQFPETFFAESLGLNLAVEMFGLGQVRLDEIRILRHYGFDDSYERLHLTIDNAFSGHVKIGVDAIHAYLDAIRTRFGSEGVENAWHRIWRGYASMAQFVE